MKHGVFLVAAFAFAGVVPAAEPDLAAGRQRYEGAVAALQSARVEAEKALAGQYTNDLNALRGKAQNDGNLGKVRQILAELARFEQEGTAPATPPAAPELQALAGKLMRQLRQVEVKEATDVMSRTVQYDRALAALQTSLTKLGKIDEATAVENERKALAASDTYKQAKAALSSTGAAATTRAPGTSRIVETLTSPDYEWSEPENLGRNVNNLYEEAGCGVTDDELLLIFSSWRQTDYPITDYHLYESRRSSVADPFGPAVPIKDIISPGAQGNPFLSDDGLTLFYTSWGLANSPLPKEQGAGGLYCTHRRGRNSPWEQPTLLGPLINAGVQENVCLSLDGLTLLFGSDRLGGQGQLDIWRSRRKSLDAAWEPPENLGAGVNTPQSERGHCFIADSQTFLFARLGTSGKLFIAKLGSNGEYVSQAIDLPVSANIELPRLSRDGRTLYFTSVAPGTYGRTDLWKIRRVPKAK